MHAYILVEALNLTAAQRSALTTHLRSLGARNDDAQPARRNHWRVRLDNLAAIYEAWWDAATVTAAAIRTRLAAIFGVSEAGVEVTVSTPTYAARPSEQATFGYGGQDRLRLTVFGGRAASWAESRAEAAAYLAADRGSWEELSP